jgi:hypothetical protein
MLSKGDTLSHALHHEFCFRRKSAKCGLTSSLHRYSAHCAVDVQTCVERAMPVLNSRCWQEGFPHSLAAARLAACTIKIEEIGLSNPQTSSDVLQSHRIKRLRASRLTVVFSPPEHRSRAMCIIGLFCTPLPTRLVFSPTARTSPCGLHESALGLDMSCQRDCGRSACGPASSPGWNALAKDDNESTTIDAN